MCVAVILLALGSDGRQEEMGWFTSEAVSSHLLNKATQTAPGMMGWIFLTALKANIDQTLCNAALVHNLQKHLEN